MGTRSSGSSSAATNAPRMFVQKIATASQPSPTTSRTKRSISPSLTSAKAKLSVMPEMTFQTVKRIGDLCGYDKLCFGSENSHTHMAVGMFQNFGEVAKKLGVDAISSENMEKIMWKNTARLWKINPKAGVRKKQTAEAS
jgi:microsomal dipeptidase-like Zn-dependent dipeptidase